MCHYPEHPELAFYDSDLQLLRNVRCKEVSIIRCNSKFVFGLWDLYYKSEIFDDDDDDDESMMMSQ